MVLCDCCQAILLKGNYSSYSCFAISKAFFESGLATHHPDYSSFEKSLQLKCQLCLRILRLLQSPLKRLYGKDGVIDPAVDLSRFVLSSRLSFENAEKSILGLRSVVSATKRGKPIRVKVDFFSFLANKQEPLTIIREPSIHNGPDSTSAALIDDWISECCEQHLLCNRPMLSGQDRMFSRILDLGADSPSSSTVRLCGVDKVASSSPYMTLSHCWGGATIPSLKKDNHEAYLREIVVADLPLTFRDAIHFTRRLSIRYLWIDAMCIQQDSNEDWLKHADLMDVIYQGSYCNIAATDSSNPYGGLFREREPALITPLRIQVSGALSATTGTFYDVGDDFSEQWVENVLLSPLGSRAWVVQERLLAPRVVHFAKRQLFWECAQVRTCEGSAVGGIDQSGWRHEKVDFKSWDPLSESLLIPPAASSLGSNYVWSSMKAMIGKDTTVLNKQILSSDPEAFEQGRRLCYGDEQWTRTHPLLLYWANVVSTYSSVHLTRMTDRLIALAGLAKILKARTGLRYIAGHWLYQLPRQLLWSSADLKPGDNDGQYIAPSWSWASRPVGVIWNLKLEPLLEKKGAMDLIDVLQAETKGTRGEDEPMGELQYARLRIRGRLLPVELDMTQWPKCSTRKDTLLQYWQASVSSRPMRETFVVPVLFTRGNESLPPATPNALLLEALEEKGTYQRIGTARLSNLCDLRFSVPRLYQARCLDFEDSDDDADTDGDEKTANRDSPKKELNPREFCHEKRIASLTNPQIKNSLEQLRAKMPAKLPAKSSQALQTLFNRFERAREIQPGSSKQNERKIILTDEMIANIQKGSQEVFAKAGIDMDLSQISVDGRNHPYVKSERSKISPNEVVGPRFYLEYLEDEDSIRYGGFVFDII